MRKCFYLVNLLISIALIIYYIYNVPEQSKPRRILNLRNIPSDAITALGDNRTFILSPYYDPRGRTPSIRVLAIIHRSVKELYCWFPCVHNSSVSIRANISCHGEWFRYPYGLADLLCTEPPECLYHYISVHWPKVQNIAQLPRFEIRNRPPPSPSVNFTVCISTMYGDYKNVLQTIQSIEMYKLLGAGRVTLYLNKCHQMVEKVLRYYVEEGILELIPWPIDKFLRTSSEWRYHLNNDSQVHYYGQTATLNDCLYRNMYRSKYVLLNDIDEIILPVKHNDWGSLMQTLQQEHPKVSVFMFENHLFPRFSNDSGLNKWPDIDGVYILHHTFKQRIFHKNRKYLVDPRRIYQASIHKVLKKEGARVYVSRRLAISFHYKEKQQDIGNVSLIEDRTLWRYNVSLTQNVNKVIQRVFLHH